MKPLHRVCRLVACLLVFSTAGCDPGYRLRPAVVEVTQGGAAELRHPSFDVKAEPARGLIGESWLVLQVEIVGNAEPVSLRSATLRTIKSTYIAATVKGSAPPGGGRLLLSWDFARPIFEVIEKDAWLDLDVYVGSRPERVTVSYVRSQ